MNEANAVLERFGRVTELKRAPFDDDFAHLGAVFAGEDFDQGRLARPVLTDKRVNLTMLDREAHIVDSDLARERLGDPTKLEQRGASADISARPPGGSLLPFATRVCHGTVTSRSRAA